jgi:osmotically-inducible protein OsmY
MRPDSDIGRDIADGIECDPSLDAAQIGVTVRNGVVTLSGFVHSYGQRDQAERHAERVAGVVGVADDIQVRLEIIDQRQGVTNSIMEAPKVTPREVRARVEDALGRNTELDASRIMIEANGSQVILRGTVRSWVRPQEAGVPSTWALLRKNRDRR